VNMESWPIQSRPSEAGVARESLQRSQFYLDR
jgi:hypothetical protein